MLFKALALTNSVLNEAKHVLRDKKQLIQPIMSALGQQKQ